MASENTNAESHPRVVRLFGNRDSAEAWAIRDFLKRSVVEFEWTELTGDEECRNALGLPSLKNVRLPVVDFRAVSGSSAHRSKRSLRDWVSLIARNFANMMSQFTVQDRRDCPPPSTRPLKA
jgi:hypothetical protein